MQVFSFYQESVYPQPIIVEVHSRFQIPSFQVLGLPAPEIQEARERIIAAFAACEFEFPKKRVVVNLAPSAVRKSGTGHDLAIAISVLEEVLDIKWPQNVYAWGELSLDGEIKPAGKMAALLELLCQEPEVERTILLSSPDAEQLWFLITWRKSQGLGVPSKITILSLNWLKEIVEVIQSDTSFKHPKSTDTPSPEKSVGESPLLSLLPTTLLPLSPPLQRLVEIAMVGRHHVLILGPKGVGKSQALEWFKALLPESTPLQTWTRLLHAETHSKIDATLNFQTPVRQVHANIKPAHLLGSWNTKGFRAGELALAHGGMLIADEFMEWPRDAKESLREPLQSKKVRITRVHGEHEFPCDLQFVGTGNLCACGGLPARFRPSGSAPNGKTKQPCRCREYRVDDYFQKLSGPIADRIDLVTIYTEAEPDLKSTVVASKIRDKISNARAFAKKNFGTLPGNLSVTWLEQTLPKSGKFNTLLKRLPNLRSRHKALRIARSIQALENSPELKEEHLFEAMSYRFTDNNF